MAPLLGCSSSSSFLSFTFDSHLVRYSSFPSLSHPKVARRKKRKNNITTFSISMSHAQKDEGSLRLQKRSLVLLGISILPFFELKAFASSDTPQEDIATILKEVEPHERAENPHGSMSEKSHKQEKLGDLLFSLLNAFGILGSGILGALYAISEEDKAALEATVKSMASLLDAKQTTMTSMKKSFEHKMLKVQQEHDEKLKKLKEQQAASYRKLASATSTTSNLDQELRAEKISVREHQNELKQLQSRVLQAGKEKEVLEGSIMEKMETIGDLHNRVSLLTLEVMDKETNVEALKCNLADKESEAMILKSDTEQTLVYHQKTNSALELLKIEVQRIQGDLKSKNSKIDELSAQIEPLVKERDESRKKFQDVQKKCYDLKTANTAKAELDSELLSKMDEEMQTLEKKIDMVVNDAQKSEDLEKSKMVERDGVKATRPDASSLSKQLMESESDQERLWRQSLDEVRLSPNLLSEEVISVKNTLQKTKEALDSTEEELKRALQDQVALERQLLEIYKKAESSEGELEETRSTVASLELELENSLEKLKLRQEEREGLERKLSEVTQLLDKMNQTTSSLSRNIESVRSRNLDLEMEKQVLSKSLSDQKGMTLEARDNIEDAQNLLQRLMEERDSLVKKNTKLEGQLAFAKGEIRKIRKKLRQGRSSPSASDEAANIKKNRDGSSTRRREEEPPPPSGDSG